MNKFTPLLLRVAFYGAILLWILFDLKFHGPLHYLIHGDTAAKAAKIDPLDYPVAKVNGSPITQRMLDRAVETKLWRSGRKPENLPEESLHLEQLVALDELVINLGADLGMRGPAGVPEPSVEDVDAELRRMKGVFASEKSFEDAVAAQGVDMTQFRSDLASQMRAERWMESKIDSALTVSDDEIATWFTQNQDALAVPRQYHASHIFFTRHDVKKPDRSAELKSIVEELKTDPAKFSELAAAKSEDERTKNSGGDLGWFVAAEAPPELSAALDKLAPGGISPPTSSPLGWHILRLEEVKEARPPTLAESAPRIRRFLLNRKRLEGTTVLGKEIKKLVKLIYSPRYAPSPVPARSLHTDPSNQQADENVQAEHE